MSVTKSSINNITSPDGNSLAVFVDGLTGVMLVKDINGNTEPISNYVCSGGTSPFEYNDNTTGIQPILGNNISSGNYAIIGAGQNNQALSDNSNISGGCLNKVEQFCAGYGTASIGGGICNTVCSDYGGVISGGFRNEITNGGKSFIGSGTCNNISSTGQYNSIINGVYNCINSNASFSSISNGTQNIISSSNSIIGGGRLNTINNVYGTIGGGSEHIVSGDNGTVSGGSCNCVCSCNGTISGGTQSRVSNAFGSIGGGLRNCLLGNYSFTTISGGYNNKTCNNCATVGGGRLNQALGRNSVVSGGCLNISGTANCCLQTAEVTSSYLSIIGGGYISGSVSCVSPSFNYFCFNGNQTNYFIASGAVSYYSLNSPQGNFYCNTPTSGLSVTSACYNIANSQTYVGLSPNIASQFLISCTIGSTIGGGVNNQALNNFATISGGVTNTITGNGCYSTISGGNSNTICSSYSIIGGGIENLISTGSESSILGGRRNTISAPTSIIIGGYKNIVSASNSAVLSGLCNIASCYNSTVISGYCNVASGNESIVGAGICNKAMAFASAVIGGRVNTVCFGGSYSGTFAGNANTICSGSRSVILGGNQNIINSNCSAILGGSNNNTCGFEKTTIIGSNICATQTCTTFMNCVSPQNLTVGCSVCVGTNKVLVNATAKVGSFFSNVTQSATTINTPKAMTLNNTDAFSSGVSIVSNSQITVDTTGIYNVQFSAQIDRVSGSGTDVIDIWYRKQGVDVANTNTKITIAGNVNESKVVASWNFFISLTAGQYVELMYSVTDLAIQLINETANLTVPHPATPSLIVTINKIS